MSHVSTNFRDFVKNHLIEETKKLTPTDKAVNENKPTGATWMDLMRIEFEEITKEYDDLYK
jgi:hypothetical protein